MIEPRCVDYTAGTRYMIVHYKGGLSVVQVGEYEHGDYRLASDYQFENTREGEEAAEEYASALAKKHGLKRNGGHDILD